jgi:ATP-dependent exoDNAse (exonuclease V) beta subunit
MGISLKEVSHELFTSFSDVQYFDEPHKYYVGNNELLSVTTLLHQYVEPFDEEYWAETKGYQFGLTSNQIKRAWRFINRKGTFKGSIIHDYAENIFQNKIFKYPEEKIISEFGFDPIWKEYLTTKAHVDKFHSDVQGKLIPLKTEYVIYDKKSLISGMIDMLFYNVKTGEIQLWDYKTNKEFSFETNRRLLGILCYLTDSDIDIYSLQLELYKQIIERNTSIKLGQSYLLWFSHNNPTYNVIKTKDVSFYVNELFKEREFNLAA